MTRWISLLNNVLTLLLKTQHWFQDPELKITFISCKQKKTLQVLTNLLRRRRRGGKCNNDARKLKDFQFLGSLLKYWFLDTDKKEVCCQQSQLTGRQHYNETSISVLILEHTFVWLCNIPHRLKLYKSTLKQTWQTTVNKYILLNNKKGNCIIYSLLIMARPGLSPVNLENKSTGMWRTSDCSLMTTSSNHIKKNRGNNAPCGEISRNRCGSSVSMRRGRC